MKRRTLRRLIHDAAGTNLLEAALVTPLLLLLTFSIVEFGSLFYVWLALENGVAQATRYAIVGRQMDSPGGGKLSREASIKAAMRQATPTLMIPDSAFTFSHMPPGGSGWLTGPGQPNDIEKVRVDYTWRPFTPLLRPFFGGGALHITVESAMKNEQRFQ